MCWYIFLQIDAQLVQSRIHKKEENPRKLPTQIDKNLFLGNTFLLVLVLKNM